MKKAKPNFYATGKAILADAIVLSNWWQEADWQLKIDQTIKAFGVGALRRGVEAALAAGKDVPLEARQAAGMV